MNPSAIPPDLFNICRDIVEGHHSKNGIGNLNTDIDTSANTMVIDAIPEASSVFKTNTLLYKIRKWCFMASIGFVILAVLVPWWSLGTLVLIFLADRLIVQREKAGWKYLATVLLGLDFLTNDFSGWGTAFPGEREKAIGLLQSNPQSPKSIWLDYYLPRRAEMDPSQLKALAPSAN